MAAVGPLGEPSEWGSARNFKVALRRWAPQAAPKAAVIILHGGVGWHSGYFDVFGKALQAAGYAAVAYDQVGCGYSEGVPGYVDSYEEVVGDLQMRLEEEQKRYKCPVFVYGESAGGLLALRHGVGRAAAGLPPGPAEGYLLSGCLVKIKQEMIPPPCVVGIVKILSRFFPRLPLPGIDVVSTFDAAFGDKRWAAAGKADPVVRRVMDARMHVRSGAEGLGAMDFIQNVENQKKFLAPFAMFVGDNECRVDTGAIFDFYLSAGSKDKYLKVIPGGYHQLLQDQPDVTKQAVTEMISWLDSRVQ